jgi:hypothetical protein
VIRYVKVVRYDKVIRCHKIRYINTNDTMRYETINVIKWEVWLIVRAAGIVSALACLNR